MDFFADQSRYRRRSHWLVALFVLAVLSVIAIVDLVVVWVCHFCAMFLMVADNTLSWSTLVTLDVVLLVAIAGASVYRIITLRGGGSVVAMGMGATPVPAGTDDPVWRRLRNVVEEVAIASSMPVFNIFVMENEPGINAFAAGYTASDAAICVTRGCLDRLTRDELQGVVAHELSHVVNGDMRLNIRLMGLLYGIIGVGVMGHSMLDSSMNHTRRRRDNSLAALMFMGGLAAVAFGAAGSLCGRLVQAAVARTRESLADASAVQYTRQTDGIAGALKKIAGLRRGSRLAAAGKREVAHMLFGAAGRTSSWFATHPPIRKRLRALGVHLSDRDIEAVARAWEHPPRAADPASPLASLSGFMAAGASMPRQRTRMSAEHPASHDFDLAANLRNQLPPALREAAENSQQAAPLLLALLLDASSPVLTKQLALITAAMGRDAADHAKASRHLLAGLDPVLRLPLAGLAFPALRRQPRPRLESLLVTLNALVHADAHVDLHEYCLMRLLHQQLHDLLDPAAGFRPGNRRLHQCRKSFANVCAIIARHGQPDNEDAAQRAFAAAMNHALPDWQTIPREPHDWRNTLDTALDELGRLRGFDKRMVIDALAKAANADACISVAERELLRVISIVLHSPPCESR